MMLKCRDETLIMTYMECVVQHLIYMLVFMIQKGLLKHEENCIHITQLQNYLQFYQEANSFALETELDLV